MARLHLTTLLLLCVISGVSAESECPDEWYRHGQKCYEFQNEMRKWDKNLCVRFAKDMVASRTPKEKEWLRLMIKEKGHDYWIGLRRVGGEWVWPDNKRYKFDQRDWVTGSPSAGTEDVCVHASPCTAGKWKEAPCSLQKGTICSKPTEQIIKGDCRWGPWQPWSACSKTCGTGRQSRTRIWKADLTGGRCEGFKEEFRHCNTKYCPLSWATCEAFGDPHYLTFDRQRFDFQGAEHKGRKCKFLLAGRCKETSPLPPFKILQINDHLGNPHVSWTQAIELHYNGHVIRVYHNIQFINVDGVREYSTKYTNVKGVHVTRDGQSVRMSIEDGLVKITLYRHGTVIVSVNKCLQGNNGLCGLCGNYDGNQANDLFLRNGTATSSQTDLGWSYQEPDKNGHFCHKEHVSPCGKTNCYHAQKCDVLNDRLMFGSCPWYYNARNACAVDMCCAQPTPDICDIFRDYVNECARLGHKVPADWAKRSGNEKCVVKRREHHERQMDIRPLADVFAKDKFSCPRKDGAFPSPGSCTQFYTCVDGVAFQEECLGEMHFSPNQSKCMVKDKAGCQK